MLLCAVELGTIRDRTTYELIHSSQCDAGRAVRYKHECDVAAIKLGLTECPDEVSGIESTQPLQADLISDPTLPYGCAFLLAQKCRIWFNVNGDIDLEDSDMVSLCKEG